MIWRNIYAKKDVDNHINSRWQDFVYFTQQIKTKLWIILALKWWNNSSGYGKTSEDYTDMKEQMVLYAEDPNLLKTAPCRGKVESTLSWTGLA